MNWFEKAETRIQNNPSMAPFRQLLLHDWIEGDDHFKWVATAPVAEIALWLVHAIDDENTKLRGRIKKLERFEPAAYRGGK